MSNTETIDVNWLRKTFEDDTVLVELYTMYVGDTEKRLAEMRGAFSANDAQRCSRIAHAMKGSSGNVGAGPMQRLAARLEKFDFAGDWAGAVTLSAQIEAEYERIKAFVADFVAGCPVSG